jgi:hypothetical protein
MPHRHQPVKMRNLFSREGQILAGGRQYLFREKNPLPIPAPDEKQKPARACREISCVFPSFFKTKILYLYAHCVQHYKHTYFTDYTNEN